MAEIIFGIDHGNGNMKGEILLPMWNCQICV